MKVSSEGYNETYPVGRKQLPPTWNIQAVVILAFDLCPFLPSNLPFFGQPYVFLVLVQLPILAGEIPSNLGVVLGEAGIWKRNSAVM